MYWLYTSKDDICYFIVYIYKKFTLMARVSSLPVSIDYHNWISGTKPIKCVIRSYARMTLPLGPHWHKWKFIQSTFLQSYLKKIISQDTSYGINLWPPSEKNHNFQTTAPLAINKVTFFSWNICPHDKTNLNILKNNWGHCEVTFWPFLPIFNLILSPTESIEQFLAFINICHVWFIFCTFT